MTKWKLPEGRAPMTDAPERIQAWETLDDYGQWATDYDGGVEYIRADLVDAIIFAAQAVIDRWDSPDWKDEKHTADYINVLRRALNTPETRADLVDASAVLEAKLAKAVQALEKINVKKGWAAHIARTTLAELEQKQ